MKTIETTVERPAPRYGWANRLLRVDLSRGTIRVEPTAPLLPDYIGGRGLVAKLAWDEYPVPIAPYAPENPLMVFTGALTGSRSPYSGRTNIASFSPQSLPFHYFTRSNVGGHFGGELKRAGYDGIIITGASETPVRLSIQDDRVRLLPAEEMWGHTTDETIAGIEGADGKGTRSLVIGPAGERLHRMATIHAGSSSACGQGGFGGVMGSKKLKAISVSGSGRVAIANPERLNSLTKAIGEEARTMWNSTGRMGALNERLAAEGAGSARPYACTEACPSPCNVYYQNVPGLAHDRTYSSHWCCVGTIFQGLKDTPGNSFGGVFDWNLGTRGGLEMNALSNSYGLNQWELIIGLVPWLEACQKAGLINEFNGMAMDWQSPQFWDHFLHDLAYRVGMGDILAEGGWRAAHTLNLGVDLMRRYYTGWGYAGHWDGHGSWSNRIVYPFWLVPALQWMADTRDPIPSSHGYVHGVSYCGPFSGRGLASTPENPITWDHMRAIAAHIYKDPDALDPYAGYKAKAYPAFFHTKHSVMKDCLPADDFVFPMIYSPNTADHFCRVDGIDGTSLEYTLFTLGTGTPWSEDEFERAAERVYTLERALQVRHWGRDRALDEAVLPSFEYRENWQSPALDQRYGLDRAQFAPVMDEFYDLQGWDRENGWPTQERLAALGLWDVYEPMMDGAHAARAQRPPVEELLPLGPIPE
jgi:aldehyde:ferredoxin oxidoreductase